jgi:diguanylate cyclase (GGDEF)-like protein
MDDQAGTTGSVRVLLVDLDPRGAKMIETMLRVTGAKDQVILRAVRVSDAASELVAGRVSCVLLSLHSQDDLESLEYLHSSAPYVPIVVVTDQHDDALARLAMRAGAQDYLVKDEVNPTLLGRAVSNAIERRRSDLRFSHQALHDPLTGLPNRALFVDRLAVAVERSHRTGVALALLFVDVDDFKDVNDSLGHAAGDRVLESLAERLRAVLRPMDTVARYGGDEFTLLFDGIAGEREALLIAERISRTVGRPIRLGDREVSVTVSVGIAMAGGPGIAADTVIGEADAAMYRAKARGGARYELFDESLRRRGRERVELEAALHAAVERSELRVHYQPKVSFNGSWRLAGFEALVRWDHPDRGLIKPGEFMAAAEATGLVQPIGEYVMGQALSELTRWRAIRPDATVSVNLSARELRGSRLATSLASAIDTSGIDPRALCLEITESAVMHESDVARQALGRLKATGIKLAIDDYGTGYSSLLSLKRLPVDVIKIHESFVHDLASNSEHASLVHAIVDVAHALGLDTVAEGVETDAQLDQVRRLGCDGAQGFLFGRPVPADAAEALLARS